MPHDHSHPLFPARDEDEDPPIVLSFTIARREPSGAMVTVPKRFTPEELSDEMQIAEWFGGGIYELTSRNHAHITGKRGYQLAGVSKPLCWPPGSVQAVPAHHDQPPAAPAVTVSAPRADATPTWVPMVGAVMPLVLQWLSGQQQMQQQSMNANQAMIQAMMAQSQNSNAQMMTLMANIAKPSVSPNGTDFKEGMNFMQEMLAGQIEATKQRQAEEGESDSIGKTLEQLMQGLTLAQEFSKMGGGGGTSGGDAAPPAAG